MSTNTKKKRGTGAAVVIIVLCLAALGALGSSRLHEPYREVL